MFIYFLILLLLPTIACSILKNLPKMVVESRTQADELIVTYKSKYGIAIFCFAITLIAAIFMITDSLSLTQPTYEEMYEAAKKGLDCSAVSQMMELSYDLGEGGLNLTMSYICGIISFIGIIFCIKCLLDVSKSIEDKLFKFNEHIESKRQMEIEMQTTYENKLKQLIEQYGICENKIDLTPWHVEESILAFSESKNLYIQGFVVGYQDILNCQLVDHCSTITNTTGQSNSVSKTDTGNAIGRAVIGGAIAGGAGAVIGGSTAKRETTTTHKTTSRTSHKHDYEIIVDIKNIANPIFKIHCGENEEASYKILGMINAIISLQE